jgi:hypothetical protein
VTDPIEGALGALVLSGWIAEAPTGQDEAYLMLTTPDERAPQTMPLVAEVFGIRLGQFAGEADAVTVSIGDDLWARLSAGGQAFERPVSAEWAQVARRTGRVVLVVGGEPFPAGMDADTYTERHGASAGIALVKVAG